MQKELGRYLFSVFLEKRKIDLHLKLNPPEQLIRTFGSLATGVSGVYPTQGLSSLNSAYSKTCILSRPVVIMRAYSSVKNLFAYV